MRCRLRAPNDEGLLNALLLLVFAKACRRPITSTIARGVVRFIRLPNRLTAGRVVHCGWFSFSFLLPQSAKVDRLRGFCLGADCFSKRPSWCRIEIILGLFAAGLEPDGAGIDRDRRCLNPMLRGKAGCTWPPSAPRIDAHGRGYGCCFMRAASTSR